MSVKPEEQHDMEFMGATERIPAKEEESPLRKALRKEFADMGLTPGELDKMEAQIRKEGREHEYVKDESAQKARPAEQHAEKEMTEHKKAFELAEKAKESFAKVPEEERIRKPFEEDLKGKEMGLSDAEERDFANWVTQKMNAGLDLPDGAAERLKQYRNEQRRDQDAA